MSTVAFAFIRHGRILVGKAVKTKAFQAYRCCLPRLISTSGCQTNFVSEKCVQSSTWDSFGIWLDEPILLPPRLVGPTHNVDNSFAGVGYTSQIGKRKCNEDRFSMSKVADGIFCFAVFDGHGGAAAADFCARNVHQLIQRHLQSDYDLESVLLKTFLQMDHDFMQKVCRLGEDIVTSGTTATVALLHNESEVVIASVGDSPAVLCREGNAVRLTEDHTPRRKDEKHRIRQFGGFVQWNNAGEPYVNGKLAMTRSIGDIQLKPFGVIAEPEVCKVKLQHTKDSFLLLTTDGVSCIMECQEMCDIVKRCQDPSEGAVLVTDLALQYGTEDNVTAMVIPFGAWGKYHSARTASCLGRIIVAGGRWS
ncbi:protein phosphatase 1K, mitochondrial-like [Protopterus annectens]|uniref:protein phosphatase 1K, mitochondrial-like n=1 Tax=Protopterus annectens TaxID=7888 RepID=UPI001CFA575A|nr:protein phosphatase 1K, mitochondrial-like [Protopterus annectens]